MKLVRVSDSLHAQLKEIADSRNKSMGDIIQTAIAGNKYERTDLDVVLEQMHMRFDELVSRG